MTAMGTKADQSYTYQPREKKLIVVGSLPRHLRTGSYK